MQHLQPGTTLQGGKYRIESVIGQGGFGNTYVANSSTMGTVAIKEFFWKGVCERDEATGGVSVSDIAHYGNFRQQKEKFKTEARRLQQFNTPHIVKVYDLFEENGTAYYVMDYIDGQNLSDRMRRLDRALTEDEVHEMLPQILEALRCVHAAGLWHLDLKPSNIMVDRQGGVRLIDFGASKQLDAQTGGATAKTRQTYTNGYAPREQMDENFSLYGAWTDIYSLGATLYCLLTKHRPPMPSDIDDDHSADKHEALPFPATVSEQMRSLVRRMMNTSRQKRPQNVDEVMAMLGISAGNAYGGGTQSQYDEATAFASHGGGDETQFAGQASQEQTRQTSGASNESTVYSQQSGNPGNYSSNAYSSRPRYNSYQSSSSTSNLLAFAVPSVAVLLGILFFVWFKNNENRVEYGKTEVNNSLGHGIYEGNINKNGNPQGNGTITYDNRWTFTGQFVDGKPHGKGVLKSPTGVVLFDGVYDNGIRGYGEINYHDVDYLSAGGRGAYVGDWDYEPSGHGTIFYLSGEVFTGEFKDGYPHGHGTLKSASGEILYDGMYEYGSRKVEIKEEPKKVEVAQPVEDGVVFVGHIGSYPITMTLRIKGEGVTGSYYYDRYGPSNKQKLFGTYKGIDEMKLFVYFYEDGEQFDGDMFDGECSDGIYRGTFTRCSDGKQFPFELREKGINFDD